MKKTLIICAATAAFALAGCVGGQVVDASKTELAVATHADLQAAAKYASDHGFPARAAVWNSLDAQLVAVEGQITACANAIAAAAPKIDAGATPPTPFLALEMGAEAVGQFSGVPASVKISCAPFPLITLPGLPKF